MATIIKERGKWRAQVRRVGAKSISKTFPTKAEAAAWARKIEAEIDAGDYQAANTISLATVIDEYRKLREKSGRPIADTSNEHYQLRTLRAMLGDKRVEALEVEHLVEFAQRRKAEGAGPYTINMDISRLGTVMRYTAALLKFKAVDVVGSARPTLHHFGLIGGGGKRERRPEGDELARIIQYCEEQGARSPVFRALPDMIRVAMQVGLRRGEISRVLWADLDVGRRVLIVRDRKDPRRKVGNDMPVPLVGDSLEIILRQPRDSDRIFPYHTHTVSKYFKQACNALSIPDLHLHDLRHETASALIEAGWSAHEVRVVTGHRSSAHLDRYVNLDPAEIARKAIKRPEREPSADGPGSPPHPERDTAESSPGG